MGVGGCRGLMPQSHDALFLLRSLLRLRGGASGSPEVSERSGSAWSRTHRSRLIRGAESATDSLLAQCRLAGYLAVSELILATSKVEGIQTDLDQ